MELIVTRNPDPATEYALYTKKLIQDNRIVQNFYITK
jgi:hypothetical protein